MLAIRRGMRGGRGAARALPAVRRDGPRGRTPEVVALAVEHVHAWGRLAPEPGGSLSRLRARRFGCFGRAARHAARRSAIARSSPCVPGSYQRRPRSSSGRYCSTTKCSGPRADTGTPCRSRASASARSARCAGGAAPAACRSRDLLGDAVQRGVARVRFGAVARYVAPCASGMRPSGRPRSARRP